jgi:hypothetical protein
MKRSGFIVILFSLILPGVGFGQTLKTDYLSYIKHAADLGWKEYPQAVENWKKTTQPSELWGYDAPGQPVYLADLLGFLYQQTQDKSYAEKARDILADYGDLRDVYPKEQQSKRAEYHDGVPAISNFFILPPYCRAYMRIRDSGVVGVQTREKIERDLAFSLDHISYFPEWGAHNRAMLRAESLLYGSLALAHHPHAGRWKQLAETLASDSLNQWEIEDATGYHGVWLYSLFSYADLSGQAGVLQSVQVKFYLDYFVQLLTPHGNIADFGDAHWNGGWERFVPVFEKAAALYHNPHYKYVAQQLATRGMARIAKYATNPELNKPVVYVGTGIGSAFTDAYRWADDSLKAEAPTSLSQEVLDDLVGKKIIFRNGWDEKSTMMLLNYRDEGDGGKLGRDYLRRNIPVEEEKMHHGHADENSIALLMSGGSVLLHDGGYRPDLPSGPFGAYRGDYFHNRVVTRVNKRDKQQDVFEFLRNSGAYRQVRTQKIDFLRFRDVDVSRTRLVDSDLGYQWDRVVTYVKKLDCFIVVDGLKALRGDYFTFTNLWHTRRILKAGDGKDQRWFDTQYDKIAADVLPTGKALLVYFPENTFGKQIGTFGIPRHFQDETAIYQTVSSYYNQGDTEFFVTILLPHAQNEDALARLRQFQPLAVDKFGRAVGLEIDEGQEKTDLCIKLDLEMDLVRENIRPRYQYQLGRVKYGDLETDASYLFAKIGGERFAYSAATMTKIVFRGKTLLEALPYTFGLQLDGAAPRTGYASLRYWEDTVPLK